MRKQWSGERLETYIYNINTIEHLHRYAIASLLSKDKCVLDIASGEGYGSNLLSKVASKVIGVDISKETIDLANNKYAGPNLAFQMGSASKIPLPDRSVDIVVSFETLEHHDQHKEMLAEIKRVIRPNGILIMSSPDKKYYSDLRGYNNPFHVKELYFNEFKDLISSHFNFCEFFLQKMVTGSLIVHENQSRKFVGFSGDYDQLTESRDFAGIYNICIASDGNLPETDFSIFDGELIRNLVNENSEQQIKNSWRYKIGNAILSPLTFFRRS